jgi:ubiquinone biosynthesis monooxygenase Coq7
MTRAYSPFDKVIMQIDQAVQTVFGQPKVTERSNPANGMEETDLSDSERDHTARLMRINHTGEVCAQALYQGQALTAHDPSVKNSMERSAMEENDHLDWCGSRIRELGGRTSLLNPFWYAGSFAIGALAGIAGDKWSLGFVAETERQVEAHLEEHLSEVRPEDQKTTAILQQMKEDEINHATKAVEKGGVELPLPIRTGMKITAKVMTGSVYYL